MNARHRSLVRPVTSFGRRLTTCAPPQADGGFALGDDLRLFAMTFAGGFLFMSVYLA